MSASIKSNSSGNLELYSGATKVLEADAGTGVVSGLKVAAGSSAWEAVNYNQFLSSKTPNGYQRLPNGLFIQWGTVTLAGDTWVGRIFPIAFPTTCFSVSATADVSNPHHDNWALVGAVDRFGMHVGRGWPGRGVNETNIVYWMAIGY